ncbi:alpha/beta fold hydrolase [Aquisalimonas sp.]|uniref:alpha/beta hydrolase n=1 Tax=Aquisalimonas sp. TaxID=1872621 RepID=UPI0025BD4CD2|nr:alpha/beta fold hydrolase [Aquisalimonas sp.]
MAIFRSPRQGHRLRLLAVVLLAVTITGCSHLFFLPEQGHRWDPKEAGIVYEDVWFEADDGVTLHGWFLPAQEPRGTVVFLHGNAQNVSTHIGAVYWLPERGFNVFMPDYRGFGLSSGSPDFVGVHRDAEAALAVVVERDDVDSERVAVLGQSLGGSVAITTVADHGEDYGVAALIADSAFSSYRGIAREKFGEFWLTWPFQWPLSLTISDRFAPVDHIADVSPIPVLLIAGDDDFVVPPHHSRELYQAARPPVEIWRYRGVGHGQAPTRADVRRALVAWLDEVLEPKPND